MNFSPLSVHDTCFSERIAWFRFPLGNSCTWCHPRPYLYYYSADLSIALVARIPDMSQSDPMCCCQSLRCTPFRSRPQSRTSTGKCISVKTCSEILLLGRPTRSINPTLLNVIQLGVKVFPKVVISVS